MDLSAGLPVIRAELENLDLLAYSEIGWLDFREGVWRSYHPASLPVPFSKKLDLIEKWKSVLG